MAMIALNTIVLMMKVGRDGAGGAGGTPRGYCHPRTPPGPRGPGVCPALSPPLSCPSIPGAVPGALLCPAPLSPPEAPLGSREPPCPCPCPPGATPTPQHPPVPTLRRCPRSSTTPPTPTRTSSRCSTTSSPPSSPSSVSSRSWPSVSWYGDPRVGGTPRPPWGHGEGEVCQDIRESRECRGHPQKLRGPPGPHGICHWVQESSTGSPRDLRGQCRATLRSGTPHPFPPRPLPELLPRRLEHLRLRDGPGQHHGHPGDGVRGRWALPQPFPSPDPIPGVPFPLLIPFFPCPPRPSRTTSST